MADVPQDTSNVAVSFMNPAKPTEPVLTIRALNGKVVFCNKYQDVHMTPDEAILFQDALAQCVRTAITQLGNRGAAPTPAEARKKPRTPQRPHTAEGDEHGA